MDYTADNLEKAVTLFYRSEAGQQAQAHQWLTEAQSSPQAWSFVWELLQPHRSSEVQFFAATTLHTKILRYWHEVPPEQYEPLKKQILDAILTYAMGPKIVLNRLCITLSAYILYTVPQHWPNVFNELLTSFQPHNLPNIQPERVIWVLLEILSLIPEEFSSMNFLHTQKNIVRNELQTASKDVLKFLEAYMSSLVSAPFNGGMITTYLNGARCATAWFQFGGLTVADCDNTITYLLEIYSNCYWANSNSLDGLSTDETELMDAILEAISTIITHASAHKYPNFVAIQMDKIMNKLIKILQVEREKNDCDMNVQVPIYTLIITCAETHSKLIIQNLMKNGTREYELSLWIIHTILMCTNTKGANPIDEECSNLTFGFWYMLQDEVFNRENEITQKVVPIVKPFYRDLITILLRKAMLPYNDDDPKWTSESKEILRCHRQDIADTLMYSYEILENDLVKILDEKLNEALQLCNENPVKHWPLVESCLYGYFAIAEQFEMSDDPHLPHLMKLLTEIPYAKLHVKVLATALDLIGGYATWFNVNPIALNHAIPLILLGLMNTEVGTSSTMALKDLSRECQIHIRPYAVQILQTVQSALENRILRVAENIRLMYSVGKVLSILPFENIMEYLNLILSPIIEDFQKVISTEELCNASKNVVTIKLRMISMLFSTLDIKSKEIKVENTNHPQPIFIVLQRILPIFNQLADKLCDDAEFMEALYSALKHAVLTLMNDCKPLVNDILQLLAHSYQRKPLASALDVTKHLIMLFEEDPECSQTLNLLLCEVVNVTLRVTMRTNLSENADLLEAFFLFLTTVFKKFPGLLCKSNVNLEGLFQCAILCLGMPELGTVKAAANFLVKFISQSRLSESLVNIIHNQGETLVFKVVSCIGGESPRSGLEPFPDILLFLSKKYSDYLARWFAVIITQEGFPSRMATVAQKEKFVKAVMKEKVNKRKMQDVVKEFSLVCRGLVGTEYGNTNLFL